jgi:hypothetical protein
LHRDASLDAKNYFDLGASPIPPFDRNQAGFAWNVFGDGRTVVRSGFGIHRDQLPAVLFGLDRFLPPLFGLEEFVFPQFLNPQNAAVT